MDTKNLVRVAYDNFVVGKLLAEDENHLKAFGKLSSSNVLYSIVLHSKDLPEDMANQVKEKISEINQLMSELEEHFEEISSLTEFAHNEHLRELIESGDKHFEIGKSLAKEGNHMKAYGKLSSSSALYYAALSQKELPDDVTKDIERVVCEITQHQKEVEEKFEKTDDLIKMFQKFQIQTNDRLFRLENTFENMIELLGDDEETEQNQPEHQIHPDQKLTTEQNQVKFSIQPAMNDGPSKTKRFTVEKSTTTLSKLGGKKQLEIVNDLKILLDGQKSQSKCYEDFEEHKARSWLIIGPAGNGKSTLVRVLANILDYNIIVVTAGQLNSCWRGRFY